MKEINNDLIELIQLNDLIELKKIISMGADINNKDEYGYSPLHEAVTHGTLESMNILLNEGAKINTVNTFGESPLHLAVENDDIKKIKLLIEHDADVNINNPYSDWTPTPFQLALETGNDNMDIIELLLNNGAKTNLTNKDEILLFLAIYKDDFEEVRRLIKNGTSINKRDEYGLTPLFYACISLNIQEIKWLIENGANVNLTDDEEGETPFSFCVGLLNNKEINKEEKECIEKILKLLIKGGANFNVYEHYDNTALAILSGTPDINIEVIKLMIINGANINFNNNCALQCALYENNSEVIELLIKYGADINTQDENGKTPLMHAILNRRIELIDFLLNNGADLSLKDYHGDTAIEIAEWQNNEDILKEIKTHKVYKNTKSLRKPKSGISIGFLLACLIASGMLFFALSKLPYGYYILLRFVVCGVSAYGAFKSAELGKTAWVWVLGIIAILFNPIVRIYLSREIWALIDVITALLLIISIFVVREAMPQKEE